MCLHPLDIYYGEKKTDPEIKAQISLFCHNIFVWPCTNQTVLKSILVSQLHLLNVCF